MNKQIENAPEKNLPIRPLTLEEMHKAAKERISLITKEFSKGFEFLSHYPRSVTVFGSTRMKEDDPYYIKARALAGRIVTELNYAVLTGGGPGIMEAANRGALEADGESLGLTIELADNQITNRYLTDNLDFYYFFSRKVCLSFSAEAYIFFPGGLGTLDEFFEIITLIQTHKIENVPVILVGKEYWSKIDELFKTELLKHETIDLEDTHLYTITDDEDKILSIIRSAPIRNGIKFNYPLEK